MAITRSQQAKQMLQDGGRIGLRFGNTGPGRTKNENKSKSKSKGPENSPFSAGFQGAKTYTVPGGSKPNTVERDNREKYRGSTDYITSVTGDEFKKSQRDFLLGVDGAFNPIVGPTGPMLPYQRFQTKRPEAKGTLGIFDILTGGKLKQRFANFLASKNRPFFINEVVRAGKIPGLNYGTIKDMTMEELEEAYQKYDRDRLAGKIDAYGNLKVNYGDDQGDYSDSMLPLEGIFAVKPKDELDEIEEDEDLRLAFKADGGRAGYRVGGASGREYDQKYDPNKKATDTPMTTSGAVGGGGGEGGQGGLTITPRRIDTGFAKRGPDVTTLQRRKPSNFMNIPIKELIDLGLINQNEEDEKPLFADASLNQDEKNIQRLLEGGSKTYKDTFEKVIGDGTGAAGGEITEKIPDLTDPKLAGSIAEAGGLSIKPEVIGGTKILGAQIGGEIIRVPTDLSQKAIEAIQQDKRVNELTRDEVIKKALDFDYPTSITKEGAGAIYDMVSLPGQNRFTAAEGGMPYEGGIMDLESARQMYGLGKLVKKVTKTVKKIVKSPLGKAAIAGYFLGGGSLGGILKSRPGFSFANLGSALGFGRLSGDEENIFTGGPFSNIANIVRDKFTSTGGKIGLGIAGVSALAGFLTPEEEQQAEQLAAEEGIDIEAARNSILAARREQYMMDQRARGFKAEGGPAEGKEPVAKKTMPLLDMGGKEMDLRAEGGFVPIGRMEKADDVPARLSKNEFVFTADAVRNAGDGDVDKGAEVMYNMMKNLEAGGDVSEESQGLEGARKMFQTSQRLEEVL